MRKYTREDADAYRKEQDEKAAKEAEERREQGKQANPSVVGVAPP